MEEAQKKAEAVGNRNNRNVTPQAPTQSKDGSWYFYNPMTVNQGKQTFQRQWGKRENVDDWQRNNRTVVNLDQSADGSDLAENADSLMADGSPQDGSVPGDSVAGSEGEEADTLANDPHNREYYLAQIPFTEEAVEASNTIIKDGLYNSGVIFKDKLDNLPLAEKQFKRLTSQYPDYEQMDLVWYHMFLLYSRMGRHDVAATCIDSLKTGFPDSEWTTLLSDPYFAENQRFGEHIEDSIYGATYEAFKKGQHDVIATNARLSEERFPLGENRPKFLFIHGLSLLNQGDAPGCAEKLKTVVEKYPQSEVSELAGMIIKGVQEGRQLYGGTFDLDDIWNRRDMTLAQDSTSTDTLSVDRDVPFLFLLVYQPDSINENQLLYEMARFNFSNFLVRNFDLNIERQPGVSRMTISGFLNYDEARQYANQLYAAEPMKELLKPCRSLIISDHNLALIGTRYSYKDYDDFYDRYFQPLKISNEELLQIPEAIEQPEETDDETEEAGDDGAPGQPAGNDAVDDFFDDLF